MLENLGAVEHRIAMIEARIGMFRITGAAADVATRDAYVDGDVSFSEELVEAGYELEPGTRLRTDGTQVPGEGVETAAAGILTTGQSMDVGEWARRLPDAGKRYAPMIAAAAQKQQLDPTLLTALVWNESNFSPTAISHAGARGLGQLMPGTAAELGVNPDDPAQNLDGAAEYLRTQIDRFGSPELALAAYNAGPERVARADGIPAITETRNYVTRVMSTWRELQQD